MMLRPITFALLALASAIPASAQEGTQDFTHQTRSSRSRGELLIELTQERAAGELHHRGETYGGFSRTEIVSTKTRAQVVAELDIARRAGELENRGEGYGSFAQATAASAKSVTPVRTDLAQAKAPGRMAD